MSTETGLLVSIGGARDGLPGFLRMGWQDHADVPFRPGDDFPFEDRAVEIILAGEFIGELARETTLHFLLECRRVLRPGGLMRIAADGPDVPRLAALVGLEPAQCAPLAERSRVVLAALRAADVHAPALELGKRDRRVTGDPLVSIVIPAFNPLFFVTCLDSALAQTYDNVEIVICDDSPGSEIEDICRTRAGQRPIRYERNEVRLRPRANFTRGFERARGEFVKFLCDDDVLAPPCVASLLDAFRRAPDIALATSRRQRIDESGNRLGDQPATLPIVGDNSVIAGYTLANAMIMAGLNSVGEPSTALFRKADLLDQAPEYFHFNDVPGHGIIDMVLWSALLLKGDAVYLRECVSAFRIHPGQRQHDPAKLQRNVESIRSLQAAWLELGLHARLRPDLLLTKPFPPPSDVDWREQPILGVAARPIGPEGALAKARGPREASAANDGRFDRPDA